MLKEPYTKYSRLHTYHLATRKLPFFEDPDLIGTWLEGATTILFFHRAKNELVTELCRRIGTTLVYQAVLDYADWETGFTPHCFTERGITVRPVWEKGEADLRLDPSVVFGNGFHPSTRLCLRYLLATIDTPNANIRTVLDLGCGTGLLSLAAAVRGTERVIALDNNRLACDVCTANAIHNGLQKQVRVLQKDLFADCPTFAADLTVANLHYELLAHLMHQEAFWQSRYCILSGFMPSQEEHLLPLVPHDHFTFIDRTREHKWCLWHLGRRGA